VSVQSVSTGILDEVEKVSGEGLYLTVLPWIEVRLSEDGIFLPGHPIRASLVEASSPRGL
jgi:hypothetical protein